MSLSVHCILHSVFLGCFMALNSRMELFLLLAVKLGNARGKIVKQGPYLTQTRRLFQHFCPKPASTEAVAPKVAVNMMMNSPKQLVEEVTILAPCETSQYSLVYLGQDSLSLSGLKHTRRLLSPVNARRSSPDSCAESRPD